MADKKLYRLVHAQARNLAAEHCRTAPEGYIVTVSEPTRNLDQNAKFHAICSDLERMKVLWAGRPRLAAEWKVLLVSGHAVVTDRPAEVVPGLEGEYVNLRESTASMGRGRASSLIEYSQAFLSTHGAELCV